MVREGKSSGGEENTATSVEVFAFAAGGVAPKKIRYTGLGSRLEKNGRWIEVALLLTGDRFTTPALWLTCIRKTQTYLVSPLPPPPSSPQLLWVGNPREDDSDSTDLELDPDASETVALCHGTPREGTGAGRA